MAESMDLDFGLESRTLCFKRAFRWIFTLPNICGDSSNSTNALPHFRGGRPSLTFREFTCEHLVETISYPSKSSWEPIDLTLYDTKENQVFNWIRRIYNPDASNATDRIWRPVVGSINFKQTGKLIMLSGCGDIIESWTLENCWPQVIKFGELDMTSSDIMKIDLTIKYDRAYVENKNPSAFGIHAPL